jgi:opacity protein-like surface antigen
MANRVTKALTLGVLAVAATFGGAAATETRAQAAFFEIGGDAGVLQRSLADTKYKADFAWQVHAEIAFIPSILMVGPYFGMQTAVPEVKNVDGTSQKSVNFRSLGARAKARIPTGGPFVPYGTIGIGWVHGNFPDQTVQLCTTYAGVQVCDPTPRKVPNATANFVEIPVGVGLTIQLAENVAINLEGDWRPTVGYKNDAYEVAAKNAQTTGSLQPPPPGRNGYAFSAMGGLSITF